MKTILLLISMFAITACSSVNPITSLTVDKSSVKALIQKSDGTCVVHFKDSTAKFSDENRIITDFGCDQVKYLD